MSKKILLLSPPNPFLENPRSVPRLGLLSLATVLRQAGHRVSLRHLTSLAELGEVENGLDWIGISATTREFLDACEMLDFLKREKHPGVVAIGGPHATALPQECLSRGFDRVFVGEAEAAILEDVQSGLPGRRIIRCAPIADLDSLPVPERGLLEQDLAWQPVLYSGQPPDLKITSLLLSRGCPYQCAFCGPHEFYRRRSDAGVADELQHLSAEGYGGLILLDDLPFLNEQQVDAFCGLVSRHRMEFRCNFRPNLITPAIAARLAQAGCRRVQIGIESASQRVLDEVHKGTRPGSNGAAVEICHASGIQVKAMFIWGLPGDGPDTAGQLVNWVRRYRPDSIQVSTFAPLPGSPLWARYQDRVSDYRALGFFPDPTRPETANGVGNERCSAQELDGLRRSILEDCSGCTRIDLGIPVPEENLSFA
jgi:radical SAM superfamily enzyme YgiQ (UPF0313 family)